MEGEEETRGRKKKALYEGANITERMMKIPDYIAFKQWADSLGLPVVEHVYLILKKELKKYKDDEETKGVKEKQPS